MVDQETKDMSLYIMSHCGALLHFDAASEYLLNAITELKHSPIYKHQFKHDLNIAYNESQKWYKGKEYAREDFFSALKTSFTDADGDTWTDSGFGEAVDRYNSFVGLTIRDTIKSFYISELSNAGIKDYKGLGLLLTSYSVYSIGAKIFKYRMNSIKVFPGARLFKISNLFYYSPTEYVKYAIDMLMPQRTIDALQRCVLDIDSILPAGHTFPKEALSKVTRECLEQLANPKLIFAASGVEFACHPEEADEETVELF